MMNLIDLIGEIINFVIIAEKGGKQLQLVLSNPTNLTILQHLRTETYR